MRNAEWLVPIALAVILVVTMGALWILHRLERRDADRDPAPAGRGRH